MDFTGVVDDIVEAACGLLQREAVDHCVDERRRNQVNAESLVEVQRGRVLLEQPLVGECVELDGEWSDHDSHERRDGYVEHGARVVLEDLPLAERFLVIS